MIPAGRYVRAAPAVAVACFICTQPLAAARVNVWKSTPRPKFPSQVVSFLNLWSRPLSSTPQPESASPRFHLDRTNLVLTPALASTPTATATTANRNVTMAEVFGVVAGGFGVVGLVDQIVKTISTLRSLRTFVENAPTELEDLIEDAEVVQGVLETLDPASLGSLNRPSTECRLRKFQKDLEDTINEMRQFTASAASRKKIEKMKLAWKKDAVKARKQNLETIKQTLLLLQASYHSVSIRQQNAAISQLVAVIQTQTTRGSTKCTGAHQEPEGGYLQISKKRSQRARGSNTKSSEYRLRIPLAFINKLWTIQTNRLVSGWTFTFQTHNLISDASPVFKYCADGNVAEVQRLFSSRLASPVDCLSNGTSLLSIAAFNGRIEICQLLLDNGANPTYRNEIGVGPLDYANIRARVWTDGPQEIPAIVDLYRLLIAVEEDEDVFLDNRNYLPHWFTGILCPPEALDLIHSRVFVDYAALPLSVRFQRTMRINVFFAMGTTPEMFQILMGGRIEPEAYLLEDQHGETLLHKVTECLAFDFAWKVTDNADGWRQMLRDAGEGLADLQQVSSTLCETPLITFLRAWGESLDRYRSYRWSSFTSALRKWVSELQAVGVDLEEYGELEREMHRNGDVDRQIEMTVIQGDMNYFKATDPPADRLKFRLLDFTYGPEPEDWFVWVTNPLDEFAGQFWRMVEREVEVMPGTWVD
ncbi:hypothetical protein BJX65DRAFT_89859 [Aspergillus insuetus]